MLANKNKPVIGDCEACDYPHGKNTELWLEHGNILMCATCRVKHLDTMKKIEEADLILSHSKQMDDSIQVVSDIFNAQTVALPELFAAIQNDETIPADQKQVAYVRACSKNHIHFQKLMFDKRNELKELENLTRMWQVNTQEAAGRLSIAAREEFRQYDVNYKPEPVKKIKSAAVSGTKSVKPQTNARQAAREAHEAASKYPGVSGASVQAIAGARHISFTDAALFLAKSLGLVQ